MVWPCSNALSQNHIRLPRAKCKAYRTDPFTRAKARIVPVRFIRALRSNAKLSDGAERHSLERFVVRFVHFQPPLFSIATRIMSMTASNFGSPREPVHPAMEPQTQEADNR